MEKILQMNVRKKITMLLFAVVAGVSWNAGYATEPTSANLLKLQDQMKRNKETEENLRAAFVKKVKDMAGVMQDYDKSARSMEGVSGLGRIERLQFQAERYSAERQVRKRVEKEVLDLAVLMDEWEKSRDRIAEDERLIALEKQVIKLAQAKKAGEGAGGKTGAGSSIEMNPRELEYYTVKSTSSLKDISALPEVYGNANAWRYIYDANRDKILTPESMIPEGMTLIVPKIRATTNFVDLN